jgi:hypothetical protein
MKAWDIDATEVVRHDVIQAIHDRINRVWLHTRCPTWVFWLPPDRLYLLRDDDARRSRIADRMDFLVGVYTERVALGDLADDIRHHVKEHADDYRMG